MHKIRIPHSRTAHRTLAVDRERCKNFQTRAPLDHEIRHVRIFLIAMHLNYRKPNLVGDGADRILILVHEHPYLLHTLWQLFADLPSLLHRHIPRTLLIEHKPHRIRPGLHRNQRILQARHPANLHPCHENNCPQIILSLIVQSAPAIRYSPLIPLTPLPVAPPASASPRSETRHTPPRAAAQYHLPTLSRSPPLSLHPWEAVPPDVKPYYDPHETSASPSY